MAITRDKLEDLPGEGRQKTTQTQHEGPQHPAIQGELGFLLGGDGKMANDKQ